MQRDTNYNPLAFATALMAVMETQAEAVKAFQTEAERIAAATAAKAEIDDDKGQLWGHVRSIAQACDEATAEHENVALTRAVFAGVMSSVKGEAADTVKAYASTGGKLIEAVRAGKLAWATLPEAYDKVRAEMKPAHKKELDAQGKAIAKAIGRIKRHKVPGKAKAALAALMEAVERFAIEADASRENGKKTAEAARELEELRQQHPAEATTVETVKAAAKAN